MARLCSTDPLRGRSPVCFCDIKPKQKNINAFPLPVPSAPLHSFACVSAGIQEIFVPGSTAGSREAALPPRWKWLQADKKKIICSVQLDNAVCFTRAISAERDGCCLFLCRYLRLGSLFPCHRLLVNYCLPPRLSASSP